MQQLRDRVAVITGAASGIGRALAERLAAEGSHLALCDVNEAGLAETAERISGRGGKVTTAILDVSDRAAVFAHAEDVVRDHGAAHLLVNNAGVAMHGTVEATPIEDYEWLMGINFWGVVYGTKAFLPHLKRAEEGHIVNISSVFGIIGVPTQSAYNAAKFGVRGFTEALRQELELEGSCVSASCVHPGGIQTNIARTARVSDPTDTTTSEERASAFERAARTSPEQAARVILDGVRKNQRRILIGADARWLDRVQRLAPSSYQRLLTALVKRTGDKALI